jgi:hypothetical protein
VTIMMKTLFVVTLALAPLGALAQEESDKVRKARSENELEKTAESTDAACGTKLAVAIDWASFDADPEWKARSVSGYCGAPLDKLRHLCEGAASKAYVAKTVKRLECRAVKAKEQWALVVKGAVVEWLVPPSAVNAEDFAKRSFLKNL